MENLSTKEASFYLGTTTKHVQNLTARGRIAPCGKIGNYNLYAREELDRYKSERRPRGRPKSVSVGVSVGVSVS